MLKKLKLDRFIPCLLPAWWVLAAVGIKEAAQRNPEWVERLYSRGLYPFFSQMVSYITGLLPFSLAELLLVVCIPLFVVFLLVWTLKRRMKWFIALFTAFAVCCGLFSVYTLGWSLNYYRLPYAYTAGLNTEPTSAEELHKVCIKLIDTAKEIRSQTAEDANGVFRPSESFGAMRKKVQSAYDNLFDEMPWLGGRYGAPKGVILSEGMSYLDISGIFIPHTIEANVNTNESPFLLPATACHEAAHQRGWAREDEANFIAYLVCSQYSEVDFRYAGNMLAVIHSMNALYSADKELFVDAYGHYSEAMLRDLVAHREHWAKYEGPVAEKSNQVNDGYLKYNDQTDGIKSYGRMVDLVIAWNRE